MIKTRRSILKSGVAAFCTLWGVGASAQIFKKKKDKNKKTTRSVKGEVTNEAEDGVQAVLQLKNVSTQDVRSYYTTPQGTFFFHGLDPNVDYEITAKAKGYQPKTRRISTFESRMELFYSFNLKSE